ncbi:Glutathione S-transferase T3 [Cardamine amara subsp. amara]|uniref:Glutathione S-transferase T3 n=1 Tax=Cardamine amara subsp. amara TaxID=228776 RepID=A0ABD1B6Q6_CARAN
MDSMNPCDYSSGFIHLLNSQQEIHISDTFSPTIPLPSSQLPEFSTHCGDDPSPPVEKTREGRRESRPKWKINEDKALISAWLNTSKDDVVGNGAVFWSRIADYYAACPIVAGYPKREPTHCRQRWVKINDMVCKFVGSYEAAQRLKKSGQNEDDIMKMAYEIFETDYSSKFNLEHAWLELRFDQKWCPNTGTKGNGSSKRSKINDGSTQYSSNVADERMARPPGVKASKGKGKQSVSNTIPLQKDGSSILELSEVWEIKKKDLALKKEIKQMRLLEQLLARGDKLSEVEEGLKNKIIRELYE